MTYVLCVNVHDPGSVKVHILVSPVHYDPTDLHIHLKVFSMNYQLFVCTRLQSCYLSKFCLNKSQWHFAIRQRAFQLWRRISKVRTVKCSNYCHLGLRPQSSNKFWMSFQEHFYAHAGESAIGGSLLCILQNASNSHLTVIVDLDRVGKTGGKSQNRTI